MRQVLYLLFYHRIKANINSQDVSGVANRRNFVRSVGVMMNNTGGEKSDFGPLALQDNRPLRQLPPKKKSPAQKCPLGIHPPKRR